MIRLYCNKVQNWKKNRLQKRPFFSFYTFLILFFLSQLSYSQCTLVKANYSRSYCLEFEESGCVIEFLVKGSNEKIEMALDSELDEVELVFWDPESKGPDFSAKELKGKLFIVEYETEAGQGPKRNILVSVEEIENP